MLNASGNINAVQPCPHLGLASDPSTSCLFVSDAHRCFRGGAPRQLAADRQSAYCISGLYESCRDFTAEGSRQAPATLPDRSYTGTLSRYLGRYLRPTGVEGLSIELSETQMGNYPKSWPRWNAKTGVALVGVVGVLVVAGGLLLLTTTGDGGKVSGASVGSERPTPPMPTVQQVIGAVPPPVVASSQPASSAPARNTNPTANQQSLATSTATVGQTSPATGAATPTTRNMATVQPTPRPVTTRTPVPTRATTLSNGQRSYVIARGDTLWSISEEFGVTVEKIVDANDLESESHIQAGQRIVIP